MALERLFRLRAGDLLPPAVLLALLAGTASWKPAALPALRYERDAVLGGEAWRLVTGQLVHADAAHFSWNVLGVLLVALLFARDHTPRQWLLVLAVSLLAVGAGLLLFEPGVAWYVGFSGALHGLMSAGLLAWLRTSRDPLTWLVVALFAAKLLWEHFNGALPFTAGSLSLPVIHQAHTFGAVGGLVAGGWIARRGRRPASL
jgi:rhomboid family GlyGly-CTERM serine protease